MKLNRTTQEEEIISEEESLELPETNNKGLGYDDRDDLLEDEYDLYGDDFLGEGSPPPVQKHADLLKDLTDFTPYLKEVINNWLGLTWDPEKKEYVENKNIKPIMEVQGAVWCSGLLRTYTRGNNIITDIGEQEYKDIMSDHIETIWLNLGTRDDLGIKEDGDLLRVSNELEHSVALVLMGAGDGKYNKFLGTTISRHETIRNDPVMPGGRTPVMPGGGGNKGWLNKFKKMLMGK